MLHASQLLAVIPTLPRVSVPAPWYRAVGDGLLQGPPPGAAPGTPPQPLWPGGVWRRGSRFTPRAPGPAGGAGIDGLYLAEDELTPLLEVTGVFRPLGSPLPLYFTPQVMLTVTGTLTDLLDLTVQSTRNALGTTRAELKRPWLVAQSSYLSGVGPMPPTQQLGEAAFNSGVVVGLRYPSSKNPQGVGLVIFTSRLVAGSQVMAVHNLGGGRLQQQLP